MAAEDDCANKVVLSNGSITCYPAGWGAPTSAAPPSNPMTHPSAATPAPPPAVGTQTGIYKDAQGVFRGEGPAPAGGAGAGRSAGNVTGISDSRSRGFGYDPQYAAQDGPQVTGYAGGSTGGNTGGGVSSGGARPSSGGMYRGDTQGPTMATVDPALLGQATGATNQLYSTAQTVGGLNAPAPGPMPTALFDRYKGLLLDPSSINQDPAYLQMMQQAQQASQRSLAAGRMSKSGNAAIEAAKIGAGTTNQYLSDLASRYGAGANLEANRYVGEAGVQSGAFADLLKKFQLSGGQYGSAAGQYGNLASAAPGAVAPVAPGTYPAGDYRAGQPMGGYQPYSTIMPNPVSYGSYSGPSPFAGWPR